jgi:mgtE-like transporter
MAVVSIVGGLLGSVVVLAASLGLTAGAVRYGWDLDNVTAPLVSTLGDVLTLPALFLATFLLGIAVVTQLIGIVLIAASVAFLVAGWRSTTEGLRRIVHESVPVLLLAGCVSALAGATLEKNHTLDILPALLVLVPAHLSSSGALGGILSGRLSSKLFLGLVRRGIHPNREARRDISLIFVLAVPVYLFNGLGADLVAQALGKPTPGVGEMMLVSLIAGAMAVVFVVAVAYYGTIAAYRPISIPTPTDPGGELVGRLRRSVHARHRHRAARLVMIWWLGALPARYRGARSRRWMTDPEISAPCWPRSRTSPS